VIRWSTDFYRIKIPPAPFPGMYSPSGGHARINGHSISTEMSEARQSLGLCPQHNMLFTDLTVYEHFMIFSMVSSHRLIALWPEEEPRPAEVFIEDSTASNDAPYPST
jgi:ABC-type multidrug transport system ATPase subunit